MLLAPDRRAPAQTVAIDMIRSKFKTISIPQFQTEKDDVQVTISSGVCNLQGIGGGALTSVPNQGLHGSLTSLSLSCSAHIDAKLEIWPHPSCGFDADISVSGGSATLLIGMTETNGKPVLHAGSVSVNPGNYDVHFGGGICGFVANLIKDIIDLFFQNSVAHEIESMVDSTITDFVNTDANQILSKVDLDLPLPLHAPYNISEIRFDLTDNPSFGSSYVGVDLLGDVVNKQNPQTAPFTPPDIPAFSNTSAGLYLELFLSPYVLESAVWTYQQAGLTSYTIKPTVLPASFPVQLNTTDIGLLMAPGLMTKYPDDWMDIVLSVPSGVKANVDATTSGISASIPIDLGFNAITPSGDANAFTLGCNLTTSLDLDVVLNGTMAGNPLITGNLTYLECPLELVNSNVGAVHFTAAKSLVDFLLGDVVVPFVNLVLNVGVPIPTMDGLTFTDTAIVLGNGYVMVGSDFAYAPPAWVEAMLAGQEASAAPLLGSPRLRGVWRE